MLEDTLALREFDLKLNNIQLERNYEAAVPFIPAMRTNWSRFF